jgi:quercetin dioxygenase-like cupin family protein
VEKMSFKVYDYKTDIRNVLVTPQIRSRFLQMQPGQVAQPHSHDLGHEVFLVLEGRCDIEIDGESQELGPGQMCVALANQIHSLRTVGNEPMTLYLSVTPHIQPTHTGWTEDKQRMPHRFAPSSNYDVQTNLDISVDKLIDQNAKEAEGIAQVAQKSADIQREMAGKLRKAIAENDEQSAIEIRNAMWKAICEVFEQIYSFGEVWNELAPRITDFEKNKK